MTVRRTLLKSDTGVWLTRGGGRGREDEDDHYRLTTLRPNQPRVIASQALAMEAFATKVAASKRGPVAVHMAETH